MPGKIMTAQHAKKDDNIISPRQVIDRLGCSKMTADRLLQTMAMSRKIKQVNVGTAERAVWIYSRLNNG